MGHPGHDGDQSQERVTPRPLSRRRPSRTRTFIVGGTQGYLTTSVFPNGDLAEVSARMEKEGSTLRGMMEAVSTAWSVGLQHAAPLEVYVRKLSNIRAQPSGQTNDPDLPEATSAMDYLARRIALDHMGVEERQALGVLTEDERRARDGQAAGARDFTGSAMSASEDEKAG